MAARFVAPLARSDRQSTTTGPHGNDTNQSQINGKGILARDEFDRRLKNRTPSYPLVSARQLDILQRDLLFRMPRDDPPINVSFDDTQLFSSFSGLDLAHGDPVFAGISSTTKTMNSINEEHIDNAVSTCISGTQAVVNTGEKIIPQGALVYWTYPLVVQEGGMSRPYHCEPEDRGRFLPATEPLSHGSLAANFDELTRLIERRVAAQGGRIDAAALQNEVKEDAAKFSLMHPSHQSSCPYYIYALAYLHVFHNVANNCWYGLRKLGSVREYREAMRGNSLAHHRVRPSDKNLINMDGMFEDDVFMEDLNEEIRIQEESDWGALTAAEITKLARRAVTQAPMRQQELLYSRIIGVAIMPSNPQQTLRLRIAPFSA